MGVSYTGYRRTRCLSGSRCANVLGCSRPRSATSTQVLKVSLELESDSICLCLFQAEDTHRSFSRNMGSSLSLFGVSGHMLTTCPRRANTIDRSNKFVIFPQLLVGCMFVCVLPNPPKYTFVSPPPPTHSLSNFPNCSFILVGMHEQELFPYFHITPPTRPSISDVTTRMLSP